MPRFVFRPLRWQINLRPLCIQLIPAKARDLVEPLAGQKQKPKDLFIGPAGGFGRTPKGGGFRRHQAHGRGKRAGQGGAIRRTDFGR